MENFVSEYQSCLPSTHLSRLLHAAHLPFLIDKRTCFESAMNSGDEWVHLTYKLTV